MSAYLDHAAATPPPPWVLAAMRAAAEADWASTSGLHTPAVHAAITLEHARGEVAGLVGADPDDIIFTAGPTEARNLAVTGIPAANAHIGDHVVLTAVEHPSVRDAVSAMPHDVVGVDGLGRVGADALAATITPRTVLVSIHHGQHEVGTVQDLAALVAAVRAARPEVRIHVDATQTVGLLPVDVTRLGVDALSFGGPAMDAPPWVGALWLRPGAGLHARIPGGAQEGGKRAGAPNLPAIAGMAAAATALRDRLGERAAARRAHAATLLDGLMTVPEVRLNGPPVDARVPGTLHTSVAGVTGESLALALAARDVAVSPGSTCTADAGKASPTLVAMGLDAPWTRSSVLWSVHEHTTGRELEVAVAAFAQAVASLRAMSPLGR